MALLGARMEETAAAAEASSDKVSAVSSTTKTLGAQLEELQKKTAAELPALAQKVSLFLVQCLHDNRVNSSGLCCR